MCMIVWPYICVSVHTILSWPSSCVRVCRPWRRCSAVCVCSLYGEMRCSLYRVSTPSANPAGSSTALCWSKMALEWVSTHTHTRPDVVWCVCVFVFLLLWVFFPLTLNTLSVYVLYCIVRTVKVNKEQTCHLFVSCLVMSNFISKMSLKYMWFYFFKWLSEIFYNLNSTNMF